MLLPSYAGLIPEGSFPTDGEATLDNLVTSCFNKEYQLCQIDPREGYVIASNLSVKGNAQPTEVEAALIDFKHRMSD